MLTHSPINPHCDACKRAKLTRKPARRVRRDPESLPKRFGDLINADHIISQSDDAQGLMGERDALIIVDRYSDYIDVFPVMRKTTEDAHAGFVEFLGTDKPTDMYIWSDSSPELNKAVKQLLLPHGRATPGRHQAKSYCERTVRRVVEGTRALLENAGLPQCFWSLAV